MHITDRVTRRIAASRGYVLVPRLDVESARNMLRDGGPHSTHERRSATDALSEALADSIDTASSASRQHYIETGRYLTHGEVAEYAAPSDDGKILIAGVLYGPDGYEAEPIEDEDPDRADWTFGD